MNKQFRFLENPIRENNQQNDINDNFGEKNIESLTQGSFGDTSLINGQHYTMINNERGPVKVKVNVKGMKKTAKKLLE